MTKIEKANKRRQKTTEIIKNMLPAERKAVELLNENPDLNDHQIGKKLKVLGYTRDKSYVLKRKKKSEILAMKLDTVRERNSQILSKQIVPKALAFHESALRDTKLDREKKFKWVKLAEDREFGTEDKRPAVSQTINVEQMQVLVQQQVDGSQLRLKEA